MSFEFNNYLIMAQMSETEGRSNAMTRMFDGQTFQVFIDDEGNPWFVAREVASFLGYKEGQSQIKAIKKYVRDSYKTTVRKLFEGVSSTAIRPKGMQPGQVLINEAGIMALVLQSSLPRAREFHDWVCSEVLPSIGRTGSYTMNQQEEQLEVELNPWSERAVALREKEVVVNLVKEKKEMVKLLQSLRGSGDALREQAVNDGITNLIQDMSTVAIDRQQAEPEPMVDLGTILQHAGLPMHERGPKCKTSLGKRIKANYLDHFGTDAPVTFKVVNGSHRKTCVYPLEHLELYAAWAQSFYSEKDAELRALKAPKKPSIFDSWKKL